VTYQVGDRTSLGVITRIYTIRDTVLYTVRDNRGMIHFNLTKEDLN